MVNQRQPGAHTVEDTLDDATNRALSQRAAARAEKRAARTDAGTQHKEEGNTHFRQKKYLDAIVCYKQAIKVDRHNSVYFTNLAAAYLELKQYEQAEAVATIALRFDPRSVKARYRRGVARQALDRPYAAQWDFETVLSVDPTCDAAQTKSAQCEDLLDMGELEDDYDSLDVEWPPIDHEELDHESVSDSSDCNHTGNGFACRFYNHAGCSKGERCAYSHAPDEKSIRDDLGKNVCLFYLLDNCKFGDAKCIYSHSRKFLPKEGWWNNDDEVKKIKGRLGVTEVPSNATERKKTNT